MEFPEDVLTIIKEFSKPIMRYSTEYARCKKALEAIGFDVWSTVKQRLCDKDADKVIEAYISHTEARIAMWAIRQEQSTALRLERYVKPTEEQNRNYKRICEEIRVCVKRELHTRVFLMEVLYTKEEIEAFYE